MADKIFEDRNAIAIPGSLSSAPNSTSKDQSNAANPSSSASTNSWRGQRGVGRGGRDQRGRGSGRERGRGRGHGGDRGGRHKNELGRAEWSRNPVPKRNRNEDSQASKRQKIEEEGEGAVSVPFTKEEIAAEERKPKRKVAVLIGYAGSGYKGMQINATEKTIEGDLFSAFVTAGAISKANADDSKKSSLVRCARTDKGVHAAGNVISLKLIVEDPEIVKKINDALPSQIRVWGFERTNGSFSCYKECDSRWYEYLIPTYSFLPPHPQSFLGKKLAESAQKEGVYENYKSRQEDVASFWEEAKRDYLDPILERLEPEVKHAVMEAIHSVEAEGGMADDAKKSNTEQDSSPKIDDHIAVLTAKDMLTAEGPDSTDPRPDFAAGLLEPVLAEPLNLEEVNSSVTQDQSMAPTFKPVLTPLEAAIKEIKAANVKAKKAYRMSSTRRQNVQDALSAYIGTRNFHNYTIHKSFTDPSAKRVLRSFKVGPEPIIINDTEWLSLKVHGQSFMMHQIRKMVAMAALVVRCGTPLQRIKESYGPDRVSIPKAPSLGLLLERPVFETYNERAVEKFQREKIDFDKFEKEIEEFKQREIYERIFREEERDHQFHAFFNHIDTHASDAFLWVTATGIPATKQAGEELAKKAVNVELDSEDEANGGDEEG